MSERFTGAILTGGRSRRMGRDKALLEVGGRALASRTGDVLAAAGATQVIAVGGDHAALTALGMDWRADHHPGTGPLGGILTALAEAQWDLVVVVATDLPDLTPATVTAVVGALQCDPGGDAALAVTDRLEPLCGAWRRRSAPHLGRAYAAGERAVHAVLAELTVVRVPVPPGSLRNVNTPADL